jgi:predicted transcriptional regulator of viral defense system
MEESGKISYHANIIQLVKLSPERFFGVTRQEYSGQEILVSDKERTLLDIMDRPEYSGGWVEVVECLRNTKSIDWDKFHKYLLGFKMKSLIQRSGYILEVLKDEIKVPTKFLNTILREVSSNIYYFKKGRGKLNKRWNVIIDSTIFKG